jgi:PAS domain S-box-containing protein
MVPEPDLCFLRGRGEVADRIAAFDWSSTSVGPIGTWPGHLRAAVATLLSAPVPMAMFVGPDGVMLYNAAYVPIAGHRHPATLGAPIGVAWPEVADFNARVIRTVLGGGTLSYRDEELTLLRNGVEEQVRLNLDCSPLLDAAGQPFGVLAFITETTEKVRFERAVLGERARLRDMFEQAPSFMALLRGPEHVFELTNAAYRRFIGHRDVIGLSVRAALPDISGQGFYELLDRVYRTGEPYVGRGIAAALQVAPGAPVEERTLDFLYHPLRDAAGEIAGIFVEGIDITDRVVAERAREASELQFRGFAESMPNHVWAADTSGRLDWFNNRVYAYTGVKPGSLDGDRWASVVHPEDLPSTLDRWSTAVATGQPYETEFRVRQSDGAWRWHLARGALIRDAEGTPRRWIGTNTDIEDQKRTERALRDGELRLRLSQEAAGIASIEVDVASGEVFGSETLWDLWGLAPRESAPIGLLEAMVVPEDSNVRSNDATRRDGTAASKVEYRIRRADTGEERWIARHIEFLRDQAGTPVKMFGVMRDITEEKRAATRQEMLTHELEHRIKNILATVSAIASQTLRDTDLETARAAFAQRIQALAAAHDILNRTHWAAASLESVVAAAVAPLPADRIRLEGPEAFVGPRRALSLALAVNELATNALKYGSLSMDEGRVEVRWSRETGGTGDDRLSWTWRELAGPPVAPPARRGFGLFLLERVLATDFGGSARIEFHPDGVECVLTAPWPTPTGTPREEGQ